ncbi:MAG: hypothetical protein EBZ74_05110 [Planctomycetia bacterium]|nr:hypothetical protein [Planctomycetia bacterium]
MKTSGTHLISTLTSMAASIRVVVAACAIVFTVNGPAPAGIVFTETFQYPIGSNLAGQNGGTGFSGAWSGGDSTIVAGIGGAGTAVQVGTQSSRSLNATVGTSGTSTYFTYLMSASSFSGGNYTGISLWNGGTENMFFGIPWNAQKFGFDAHGGNGAADIKAVDFTPSPNTTYLVAVGLVPSATAGKVDVKMWATSNLAIDPNTLIAGSANASLIGSRNNFSYNTVSVAGNYAGSLKVSGLASSPNVSEAASVSIAVASIPEIDPAGFGSVAALVTGALGLIERRRLRTKAA